MKANVKIFFFSIATKVVKINNQNPKFKLRIRILSGSKNLVGFGIRIAIPRIKALNFTSFVAKRTLGPATSPGGPSTNPEHINIQLWNCK